MLTVNANSKPVYCSTCKGRDTWQRDARNDVFTTDGTPLYDAFKCSVCGNKTIRKHEPVDDVKMFAEFDLVEA